MTYSVWYNQTNCKNKEGNHSIITQFIVEYLPVTNRNDENVILNTDISGNHIAVSIPVKATNEWKILILINFILKKNHMKVKL